MPNRPHGFGNGVDGAGISCHGVGHDYIVGLVGGLRGIVDLVA